MGLSAKCRASSVEELDALQWLVGLPGNHSAHDLVLTVNESPRAATTLMSAGRSLWTNKAGKKRDNWGWGFAIWKYELHLRPVILP
jgi:hypothetical protein